MRTKIIAWGKVLFVFFLFMLSVLLMFFPPRIHGVHEASRRSLICHSKFNNSAHLILCSSRKQNQSIALQPARFCFNSLVLNWPQRWMVITNLIILLLLIYHRYLGRWNSISAILWILYIAIYAVLAFLLSRSLGDPGGINGQLWVNQSYANRYMGFFTYFPLLVTLFFSAYSFPMYGIFEGKNGFVEGLTGKWHIPIRKDAGIRTIRDLQIARSDKGYMMFLLGDNREEATKPSSFLQVYQLNKNYNTMAVNTISLEAYYDKVIIKNESVYLIGLSDNSHFLLKMYCPPNQIINGVKPNHAGDISKNHKVNVKNGARLIDVSIVENIIIALAIINTKLWIYTYKLPADSTNELNTASEKMCIARQNDIHRRQAKMSFDAKMRFMIYENGRPLYWGRAMKSVDAYRERNFPHESNFHITNGANKMIICQKVDRRLNRGVSFDFHSFDFLEEGHTDEETNSKVGCITESRRISIRNIANPDRVIFRLDSEHKMLLVAPRSWGDFENIPIVVIELDSWPWNIRNWFR